MSNILSAIILGIIQGLTEFLPVSSSGHLEIAKQILGHKAVAGENITMTIVLHAATALSTIIIFRNDVKEILAGLFQFRWNDQSKFSLKILISMIPAAFVGLIFDEEIDNLFNGNLLLVGCMLIVTALLLFLADKARSTRQKVGFLNALIIGLSQAIAILPGISRSGATISTSVLLGLDKEKAARFSFLMVVPLILGKMAKDLISGEISAEHTELAPLIVGFLAAFLTGLFACKLMIKLVKNSQLKYFSFYCIVIAIISISLSF